MFTTSRFSRATRRAIAVATITVCIVLAGSLALLALGDPNLSSVAPPRPQCPGPAPHQIAQGHFEIDPNAPLSASPMQAVIDDVPDILPAASASAFRPSDVPTDGLTDPDVQPFELRSAAGDLLARVQTQRFAKGWAVTGWSACAFLTGPPTPATDDTYDPNESTDD